MPQVEIVRGHREGRYISRKSFVCWCKLLRSSCINLVKEAFPLDSPQSSFYNISAFKKNESDKNTIRKKAARISRVLHEKNSPTFYCKTLFFHSMSSFIFNRDRRSKHVTVNNVCTAQNYVLHRKPKVRNSIFKLLLYLPQQTLSFSSL